MTEKELGRLICGATNPCKYHADMAKKILTHFVPKEESIPKSVVRKIVEAAPPTLPDVDPGLSREEILAKLQALVDGVKK